MPSKSPLASGGQGVPGRVADGTGESWTGAAGGGLLSAARLRGYWLTPPGVTVILATVLAFGLRLFVLTRPGLLTGVTEYDDGVYLGAAIRLTEGALPYRDYAFVQPPGILLLTVPVAVIGRIFSTAAALGVARVLTVCASTACVLLAGNLMRYRGIAATAVTCGFLAVYPDDVFTARTLLLEPWMNLCCLIAVNVAFRRGRLAGPGRLAWAGVALGFAVAVKYWAVVPAVVLFALCLISRKQSPGRARACLAGLAIGFVVPVAPFALAAPAAFVRSTVLDQASRVGAYVPMALRLAHVTGLIDVLNVDGKLALATSVQSLFLGTPSLTAGTAVGWLPFAAIGLLVAVVGTGYSWDWHRPSQLEWFALAVAVLAAAAILSYSAFFYHYPSFVAPWLALALGGAAGCLPDRASIRRTIVALVAVLTLAAAVVQVRALEPLSVPDGSQIGRLIPPGACVVTDEISVLISADRFNTPSGCPDIIDSLATTLVVSHGVSVQGGAGKIPAVVDAWQSILGRARYVLLAPGSARRIPPSAWFRANFTPVGGYYPYIGQLYERRT
jgi:alpha-1,2-mannosyltransferase